MLRESGTRSTKNSRFDGIKYRDLTPPLTSLQHQHDKIKRKALLAPNTVGQDNSACLGGPQTDRRTATDHQVHSRTFGANLGNASNFGAIVGGMDANGVELLLLTFFHVLTGVVPRSKEHQLSTVRPGHFLPNRAPHGLRSNKGKPWYQELLLAVRTSVSLTNPVRHRTARRALTKSRICC
jgi:hypothetical protein